MTFVKAALLVILTLLAALILWRVTDTLRAGAAWARLAKLADGENRVFDLAMVADLPEPARRYFAFTIRPGTRLSRVTTFEMTGEMGLGTKEDPKYQPMRARQILAPPDGLVWRLNAGIVSGSDGALPDTSWTRFWLFHILPIVRISDDADHLRSAFGRVVAEAAFWTPASLLPSDNVTWEHREDNVARAVVTFGDFTQWVDIKVRADGAPVQVVIERWSNANADATYRSQPFGGTLSEHRDFGGYRVPTRVEGGNLFGTDAYFPFFKADLTSWRPL